MSMLVMQKVCAHGGALVTARRSGYGEGRVPSQAQQNLHHEKVPTARFVRVRSASCSLSRDEATVARAVPTDLNDVILQGGPLLLPLVLSTSAALYRGAKKAKKDWAENGLIKAFAVLPPGMWVGIGLVWAHWTASQVGVF
tara:strand:+ start:1309 stop:1731 length:423 start_codon:yes stop_codon:yes gene_type:complete